jgi:hypothetical protein
MFCTISTYKVRRPTQRARSSPDNKDGSILAVTGRRGGTVTIVGREELVVGQQIRITEMG